MIDSTDVIDSTERTYERESSPLSTAEPSNSRVQSDQKSEWPVHSYAFQRFMANASNELIFVFSTIRLFGL